MQQQQQPSHQEQINQQQQQPLAEAGEISDMEEAQLNALNNMQDIAPEVYAEMMNKLEGYYKENSGGEAQ